MSAAAGGPRRWEELAWPELSFLGQPGSTEVGLVPVGATEQHGPHLPTATDSIIATALCDAASAATGALVLPTVTIGCSYGHGTVTPGTLSLSPEGLAAVLRQYAEWAAYSGLRRLIFVNAHFGNNAAIMIATDHIRYQRPDLRAGIFSWYDANAEIAREATADGADIHANRAETALMLAIAPDLVHADRCAGSDDPDRTAGLVFRYTAPRLSANGVTGRPSEATTQLGASLRAAIVGELAGRISRGRREEPPLG